MFKPTSNNIFVPRPRTEAAKRVLAMGETVMWSGLENELKDEINLKPFKSALSLPEAGIALRELR